MAHQIYPDAGLLHLLSKMVAGDLHYHLFTNNADVDRDSVLGDFTEAVFSGYAIATVAAADFILSGVAGHVGTLMAAPIAFPNTSGGDQDAYGYYVTNTANTVLIAAAKFDSAPITKATGDSFHVIPLIGDFSEFAT